LHLFHDDNVPEDIMANVTNQIRQLRPVPKRVEEYSEEELSKFPKLFDLPDDHVPK
jgi:large subunit ribosomal protein L13